jgi:carbon storage regulator CsrA
MSSTPETRRNWFVEGGMIMVILNRKVGERLILVPHCELTVTVMAIEGDTVRLSISAPTQVASNENRIPRRFCKAASGNRTE